MSDSIIICGDVIESLSTLSDQSVNCVVTSPPYWGLRDYGIEGQIGLESTPEKYTERLVEVFRDVWRVLQDDGTLWLNLGDTYASAWPCQRRNVIGAGSLENGRREARPPRLPMGIKEKDLIGIPWRVAFALQSDNWYLRSDIIWSKPNPMPESVRDRPTKAHEYLFLLAKSAHYYFDQEACAEQAQEHKGVVLDNRDSGTGKARGMFGQADRQGNFKPAVNGKRNIRSVWTIATQPYKGAHFATFPKKLVTPCILAGCPVDGTVLDPFCGSGTVGCVCMDNGRNFIGIELNPKYVDLATARILKESDVVSGRVDL